MKKVSGPQVVTTAAALERPLPAEIQEALGEAQVPARLGIAQQRGHPATLTKPPDASRRRHPDRRRGVLAAESLGDLTPKPQLDLASMRRLARRLHRRPARQRLHPPRRPAHQHLQNRGVATTG